jgi:hypothetical protein
LRNKTSFTFIQGISGVFSFDFEIFSDRSVISQGVFAVVVNAGVNALTAKFDLEQVLYVENWVDIHKYVEIKGNNGYSSVDFSSPLILNQIRGSISCTRICNIFLLSEIEFNKLKANDEFSFIQGIKEVNSFTFTTVNNRSIISTNLFAVVVNPGNLPLTAEYNLQQDLQYEPIPEDWISCISFWF